MKKRGLALMGCLAVMAAALGGFGQEEGTAAGNGAGAEAAPERNNYGFKQL